MIIIIKIRNKGELINNKKRVYYNNFKDYIEANTVIFAIGREYNFDKINLSQINIEVNKNSGKIVTKNESTNISNIYALGDVVDEGIELTPVAIKSAKLLINRLYLKGYKL